MQPIERFKYFLYGMLLGLIIVILLFGNRIASFLFIKENKINKIYFIKNK